MSPTTIYKLPWQAIRNPLLRWLMKHTHRWIEKLLGLTTLERFHETLQALPSSTSFPRRVLDIMQIRIDCNEENRARIPATGPLAVVANHPYGAVEGLGLLETIRTVRPDVKVLANFILSRIPELREDMIFVNPFSSSHSMGYNIHALRQALNWIKEGHALIIFPAGEVASYAPGTFRVREAPWHTHTITLIRKADPQTRILPVYIPGKASLFFHLLGKIHPRLRTLLLPREMLRLQKHSLALHIGHPIDALQLHKRFQLDSDALRWLRFKTFLIEGRIDALSAFNMHMRRLTLDTAQRHLLPLAPPLPKERIIEAIIALPEEALLLASDTFNVYLAHGSEIPDILYEIGRLREMTFRAIGEGTEQTLDVDDFDEHYHHVFLWHTERQEIVGSYRLGFTDRIVEEKGLEALYTRTLFEFDENFLGRLPGAAIELGRSFVRPEYQRTFAPLLLLWKGVLSVVARHPQYTILFGPVSISHDYHAAARDLLISYLKATAYDVSLTPYVSARLPPKLRYIECLHQDYADFISSEADVYDAITEIEEGRREMPVLIRQYLKLGGQIVAFNVDPEFGTVVDGLIYVNLLEAPPRDIARYMGKDVYNAYLNTPREDE